MCKCVEKFDLNVKKVGLELGCTVEKPIHTKTKSLDVFDECI